MSKNTTAKKYPSPAQRTSNASLEEYLPPRQPTTPQCKPTGNESCPIISELGVQKLGSGVGLGCVGGVLLVAGFFAAKKLYICFSQRYEERVDYQPLP